jgi:hypothetical protein
MTSLATPRAGSIDAFLAGVAIALAVGVGIAGTLALAGDAARSPLPIIAIETAMPDAKMLTERWAASPLILRSRAMTDAVSQSNEVVARADDPVRGQVVLLAAGATVLLGLSLLESLLFAIVQTAARSPRQLAARPVTAASRPLTETEYQARCQQLFQTITTLWARAEIAVFDLDDELPLRNLLFKEMKQISQRLALDPNLRMSTSGAITAGHGLSYWKSLSQRLNQSARDLNRIGAVAEAAGVGFGGRNSEARIPKTRDEACFILGANREAEPETLQRLVKALRQCWHPDLAQTEPDRRQREARLKQINAAHDLITGKRVEG